jgi:hypothetical protein
MKQKYAKKRASANLWFEDAAGRFNQPMQLLLRRVPSSRNHEETIKRITRITAHRSQGIDEFTDFSWRRKIKSSGGS